MYAFIGEKMRKAGRSNDSETEQEHSTAGPSRLDELHALSRKGLWGLLLFLAASAVALSFRDATLAQLVPAELLEQLGPRPPVLLINTVLGVSTVCSLIIICGRLYNARKPGSTWSHLLFRLSFFPLYFISDALGSHLNVIFISGLAVLALQHYHISTFTTRMMEGKTGEWGKLSV